MRVSCCRKDRSRVISHSEKGYSTYCFRCGEDSREFIPHGERSLADRVKHRRELEQYAAQSGPLRLPEDFTEVIPPAGLVWLLKGGVSTARAAQYGIGWSEKLNRVVIPVRDNGELLAVQMRAVLPNQQPKYLNVTGGEESPVFKAYSGPIRAHTGLFVLTEDILSAIRIQGAQRAPMGEPAYVYALASLGTHLSQRAAAKILGIAERGFVWYDGDEAGIKGARKALKVLQLQGARALAVRTDEDPKAYSNAEILEILGKNYDLLS